MYFTAHHSTNYIFSHDDEFVQFMQKTRGVVVKQRKTKLNNDMITAIINELIASGEWELKFNFAFGALIAYRFLPTGGK